MAETISSFLRSIDDSRKRQMAEKSQALLPYLDYMYQYAEHEKRSQIQRDETINDSLAMARGMGIPDEETSQWAEQAKGLKNPGAINQHFTEQTARWDISKQLTELGVKHDRNMSAPELNRILQAQRAEAGRVADLNNKVQISTGQGDPNDPDVVAHKTMNDHNIEKSAKTLGTAGYKRYQKLVSQGNDPAVALADAERFVTAAANPPKGTNSAADTTENIGKNKAKAQTRINEEKNAKGERLGTFVYWLGSGKKKVKAAVYTDGKGKVYWADTDEEVNLDDVLPVTQIGNTKDYQLIKKSFYRKNAKTTAGKEQPGKGSPVKTADEFLKQIGL